MAERSYKEVDKKMTKEVQQELLQFYTGLAEAAVKAEKWDMVDYFIGKIQEVEDEKVRV